MVEDLGFILSIFSLIEANMRGACSRSANLKDKVDVFVGS